MQVDYLIIGQGISGTWLSYYLKKEGKSFIVIDNNFKNSSSKIAAGIINPVTGRRHVTVWLAEEIIPFAWNAYHQMGNELGITAISQKNIIDFFPSPQMRISFLNRVEEDNTYVSINNEQHQYHDLFQFEFGFGVIHPSYTAHLETILPAWRKQLKAADQLQEEAFDITRLKITKEKIQYDEITAAAIIFCDGNSSTDNPYFKNLPFAPNKGEALLVEIPGLPKDRIFKKGMMMAPFATSNLWWVGSSYAWEFDHLNPTNEFKEKTEKMLKEWLKIPFKTIEHLSGIRPATLERRPFVGMHPLYPNLGILNGMGTKGCSLAPFFASQLVRLLLHHGSITPEADIKRFAGILARNE
ncbi:MAG: NAD(P)/FAD-dependent oxidoreductase [Chitinophagaceae bacterium]